MKLMIDQFTFFDLFGHDNYEFYARVTGRILRVQGEWICSFRYPAPSRGSYSIRIPICSLLVTTMNLKFRYLNYYYYYYIIAIVFAVKLSLQTEKTWLQCQCDRWLSKHHKHIYFIALFDFI